MAKPNYFLNSISSSEDESEEEKPRYTSHFYKRRTGLIYTSSESEDEPEPVVKVIKRSKPKVKRRPIVKALTAEQLDKVRERLRNDLTLMDTFTSDADQEFLNTLSKH